jgi:N-acetylglucosaminyldiphosphoundecaprenol N-acetyl-beta-D-mannosaminyltransferase
MKIEILGVKIDNLSLQEVLENIKKYLISPNQHYIVTPNPEFLVAAQTDSHFKEILNYADIAIADGYGLVKAAKFFKKKLFRITGVDLIWFICQLAEQNSYSVYFLGGFDEAAQKTADSLVDEFPNLIVAGAESGGEIRDPKIIDQTLIENINRGKPQILFVALGQVKQEKWIFHNLDKLPTVKVAMGVGGAFDYVSGQIKRAPEFYQKFGLEWLYRLVQQPQRWPRIVNAVIVFPWLVLKSKIKPN